MAAPVEALLQKKVELLCRSTDYKLLLETAATLCLNDRSGLPENTLAVVADLILRPIARDISALTRGSKIMLHIYVSGG